ncbi:MAG: hypothetical protein RI958_2435 [Actinomycetota bacterium]|jgi:heat shock protein HslJ
MNRFALAIPVLSASLLLVATGCGDDTVEPSASVAPASTNAPAPGAPLEPRSFIATASTGFTIVEGSRVMLTFEDGRLSVNAGCNSMSGMYVVVQEALSVEPMAMTEMACEPALMEQDALLAEFLTSGPAISITGDTLTLGDETMGMTLLDREVADPDRPLGGTVWTVTTVIDADAAMSGWGEATASITIELAGGTTDGTIDGTIDGTALVEAGCNRGSATVVVTSDTVTFGPLALTKMLCDGPAMELETAVVATLAGTVTYTIEADRLTLTNGESGLILASGE